jgi:hypothetical protein
MDGRIARDSAGHGRDATWLDGYALHLDGRPVANKPGIALANRSVHLAGGRLLLPTLGLDLGKGFVLALEFWNGLPPDARPVCGTLVDLGGVVRVGVGGTSLAMGRLTLTTGVGAPAVVQGTTVLETKRWYSLVIESDGARLRVSLDGRPEIQDVPAPQGLTGGLSRPVALGGTDDPFSRWEGKLDEAALFDRPADPAIRQAVLDPNRWENPGDHP